eukprot:m.15534 g.15534  ORF g.15534 m.15534 type:complete len:110 (-) comp10480_c0_seq1:193-522(-)
MGVITGLLVRVEKHFTANVNATCWSCKSAHKAWTAKRVTTDRGSRETKRLVPSCWPGRSAQFAETAAPNKSNATTVVASTYQTHIDPYCASTPNASKCNGGLLQPEVIG